MNKNLHIISIFLVAIGVNAQTINWQNTIGGESSDRLRAIEKTFDGHFIIGGTSTSGISGDKTEENRFIADPPLFLDEPRAYQDYWVMKINKNTGAIIWQKTVGGAYADTFSAIKHTTDGGYLLVGTSIVTSNFVSGERTANPLGEIAPRYAADIWLVKLDAFGDVVWDKTHGSAQSDIVADMIETHDGGYLMVGSVVSEGASGTDILIIKIDASGNEQWQRSIVGNNYDSGISAVKTSDNGFVIIASSNSGISNDKTSENEGQEDFWVIKIDNLGNIIWQRNIGGEVSDDPIDIIATSDGNFLITGASDSYISGDKTENAICNSSDAWIVKIDKEGNILWDKTIGGDNFDWFSDIIETEDGGFLLGGISSSNISGYKTESTRVENDFVRCCVSDFWIVKIDKNGNFEFDKTIGGYGSDSINAMLQLDDGSYVLAGDSVANISGEKTEDNIGDLDYWIVNIDIGAIDTPVNTAPTFNELLVCEGEMVQLSTVEGQSYSWSGPNGFTSTDQNPFINNVSSQNTGIYNGITYFSDGCIETKIIDLSTQNCTQTNVPPEITASGDQSYCFGNPIRIATDFDITDPDDTGIEAFFIQISEGYTLDEDVLMLTGNHPNITSSWDSVQGKLSFFSATTSASMLYVDVIAAVRDVVYSATVNTEQADKIFSFTIGDANFLPATGHFYEYIPEIGITWSEARAAAASRTYFGLQGYLATITSAEEAQITGEQAAGTGWIGANDVATEGVWQWVTGPEAGIVFWNGGINGTTPNFANWNTNEPNDCCSSVSGEENYAHVTSPNIGNPGSWNDLPLAGDPDPNSDFYPQGYIVEYGGMPGDPAVNISASTKISFPSILSPVDTTTICGSQSVSLEAIPSSGEILWFENLNDTTPVFVGNTFATPVIQTTRSYFALVSDNGCLEGERFEFPIIVNQVPNVEPLITFKNCDEDGNLDGFTDFNLNEITPIITDEDLDELNITFYLRLADAELRRDTIEASFFNNQIANTIYARVEFIDTECYDLVTINLETSTTSFPSGYISELELCDADTTIDGITEFDLTTVSANFINQFPTGQNLSVHYYYTETDAQLEENEITNTSNYQNQTPFSETLYVRVESNDNGNCFGIGPHLVLTVHPRPEFEIEQSNIFCLNGAPVTLSASNASLNNLSYEWSDPNGNIIGNSNTVDVTSEGIYSAVATSEENCQSEQVFIELRTSGISNITIEDVNVVDLSNNNSITISMVNIGVGDYEFALDNEFGLYQDNTVFSNVTAGEHILYVRDKNGCGTVSLQVFVMGIPKFFTPNGDGANDTWNIKGLSNRYQQNTTVYIYDRYGKLIKQLSPSTEGWNGTFNGQLVAADDYWYVVSLVDDTESTRVYKGHFSLIR
ncbi:T9SS type B sorting domain-containing protein [Algibacter aquimarinus]|uniref:C-type lectin domain-containing protein n=1 Tax=Algibacter aquimarinus TaxID=1136748 RepID=A0ABP9H8M6_9FLAO